MIADLLACVSGRTSVTDSQQQQQQQQQQRPHTASGQRPNDTNKKYGLYTYMYSSLMFLLRAKRRVIADLEADQ